MRVHYRFTINVESGYNDIKHINVPNEPEIPPTSPDI